MTSGEKVTSCLGVALLVAVSYLVALAQRIDPFSDQPFRLESTSELAGALSVNLKNESTPMLTATVKNQNNVSITVAVPGDHSDTHWAAFEAACARAKANTSITE